MANKAIQLNGATQYGTLTYWIVGTVHSVAHWVKLPSGGTSGVLHCGSGTDLLVVQQAQGALWYFNAVGTNVHVTGSAFTVGAWYHVAVVRNGTTVTFYVNGAQVGTPQTLGDNVGSDISCMSGGYAAGLVAYDEVKIWSTALAAGDILADYNAGAGVYGGPGGSLIGGWHLDEGTGTSAADYSGNGRTITMVGAPSWVDGIVGEPAAGLPMDLLMRDLRQRQPQYGRFF